MAAVDHERVVLALKAHLGKKRSHSATELFEKIAQLEVECSTPETLDEFERRQAARGQATSTRPASALPA